MPKRSRLLTTIFRPDVWFVMPPVCNVIFPEECVNVNYTRQMMRETTRLQLQTFSGLLNSDGASGASQQLIERYYFAPALIDVGGALTPSLPEELGKSSSSALTASFYAHEKFTGIVPKIERIADTAFYAAGEIAAGNSGFNRNALQVPTIEQYAQRVALFNLLRNRYMARQAGVTGRFMPRLVAGFPALIVNRPPSTRTEDPTHFIGLISSLSHTLSQDGGNTTVNLSYARPHTIVQEDDSFLVLLKALQAESTTSGSNVNSVYDGTTNSTAARELSDFSEKVAAAAVALAKKGKDHTEIYRLLTAQKITEANALYASVTNSDLLPDFDGLQANSFSCRVLFYNRKLDDQGEWGSPLIEDFWDTFQQLDTPTKEAMLTLYRLEGILAASTNATTVDDLVLDDFQDYENIRQGGNAAYIGGQDEELLPQFISLSFKTEPILFKRSFEQIVTPAWFSDTYSNEKISAYYESLLGCKSLGDFVGMSGLSTKLIERAQENSDFSVERSSRQIVALYAAQPNVKTNDGDPEFIYNVTKREIATKAQALHFHRFAVADAGADTLYGLDSSGGGVQELNESFVAASKSNTGAALDLTPGANLDPRQDRRYAVQSYVGQLSARAFRG